MNDGEAVDNDCGGKDRDGRAPGLDGNPEERTRDERSLYKDMVNGEGKCSCEWRDKIGYDGDAENSHQKGNGHGHVAKEEDGRRRAGARDEGEGKEGENKGGMHGASGAIAGRDEANGDAERGAEGNLEGGGLKEERRIVGGGEMGGIEEWDESALYDEGGENSKERDGVDKEKRRRHSTY